MCRWRAADGHEPKLQTTPANSGRWPRRGLAVSNIPQRLEVPGRPGCLEDLEEPAAPPAPRPPPDTAAWRGRRVGREPPLRRETAARWHRPALTSHTRRAADGPRRCHVQRRPMPLYGRLRTRPASRAARSPRASPAGARRKNVGLGRRAALAVVRRPRTRRPPSGRRSRPSRYSSSEFCIGVPRARDARWHRRGLGARHDV